MGLNPEKWINLLNMAYTENYKHKKLIYIKKKLYIYVYMNMFIQHNE